LAASVSAKTDLHTQMMRKPLVPISTNATQAHATLTLYAPTTTDLLMALDTLAPVTQDTLVTDKLMDQDASTSTNARTTLTIVMSTQHVSTTLGHTLAHVTTASPALTVSPAPTSTNVKVHMAAVTTRPVPTTSAASHAHVTPVTLLTSPKTNALEQSTALLIHLSVPIHWQYAMITTESRLELVTMGTVTAPFSDTTAFAKPDTNGLQIPKDRPAEAVLILMSATTIAYSLALPIPLVPTTWVATTVRVTMATLQMVTCAPM
jgi:hypothetical protein